MQRRFGRAIRSLCGVAAIATAVAMPSVAAAAADDHPLVSRYPGSTLTHHEQKEFSSYTLVVGLDSAAMKFEGKPLEGRVTRITYTNPADRSTLEIYRNYEQALAQAGIEPLFACAEDACGPAFARSAWGRFNGLTVTADGDPRYLAGKVRGQSGEAYVALMVAKRRTQLDVVESTAMDVGLVAVDADALGQGLDRDGKVSVYGIYFDTDRAVVKPESKPAIDAIAKVLAARPALSVYIVGHTDMTGSFERNRALSQERAAAVVAKLIAEHRVDGARLTAHGVGPLAPSATNATEAGRAKNRRVELVRR